MSTQISSRLRTHVQLHFQRMLARIAALQFDMRRLADLGHAHPRMRELCELLDALESSLCWDLVDDLDGLARGSAASTRRILDWMRADIEPISRLVCCLDSDAPEHPLVTAAMFGCGEIVEGYLQIETALAAVAPAHRVRQVAVAA